MSTVTLLYRYREFNTPTALAQLDDAKLNVLGIEDKELRKVVLATVHKAGYTASAVAEASPSNSKPSTAVNFKSFPVRSSNVTTFH